MSRPVSRLLVAAALLAAAARTAAAPVLRHQELLQGDFALVGNTLAHDCSVGTGSLLAGTVGTCGSNSGDSGVDVFWQSNPGAGTAAANNTITVGNAQSTAMLDPGALPTGATVTYARLYWGAHAPTNAYGASVTLVTPDGAPHALSADAAASKVVNTGTDGYRYQSSADVTAIVKGLAAPRGRYTVSGVTSVPLVNQNSETLFDAWWMVVFYSNPSDPALRQVTLFDGLDYVQSGAPADVTLGGFLVPNGGWDAKLGVVVYEGDQTWTGDALQFQGYTSSGAVPTTLTTLSDAQNPANNFFNGTRSWLGAARTVPGDLPQYSGAPGSMQSFDMDVVDLKALGAIHAGDDSARIRATSSLDRYALGAFITSINTLKPSFIQTVKSATNLTRGTGVFAGDLIEYTIDTQNTGNDPSIQTVMRDVLPEGVTYVPGSLQISAGTNAGPKTDADGDDQAEYVTSTRSIFVRLGTGANAWVGGSMAIGEAAQVKLRVTVDAGAAGVVQNLAEVVAGGLSGEPAHTFDSTPPGGGSGPTPLPVDQCFTDASCGGATPACWTAPTPNVCVACTSDAYCGGATPICDLTAHACVGVTTLSPAAQVEATVAGAFAPFAMTLTSNLAGPDTYELDVVDGGCGWGVELRSDGGALLGTRSAGGVWTVAPGGDSDADGKPDLGPTAGGGGTTGLVLRLTPPGGTAVGASCTATVVATGRTSGLVASASATLRVGAAASWTPDYTGGSARVVSRGGDVGFPGVIENDGSAPLTFDLATTVTATPDQGALQPATFWSDPNGDGDPSDGAPITSVGPVPAYGGRVHVVLVLHAVTDTGTPLATGTVLDATSTATAGAVVATQVVEARAQYAATYSDAARTLVAGTFGPCDTVYLGATLLPSGSPFALEWYPKASPVRGTDVPSRTVDPWPVSGGAGSDQLQVPANALGTWTVLVVQKTTPATVLDAVTFQVERAGAFTALTVPARIATTGGLSVSASVQNQNGTATFAGTQLAYTVSGGGRFMDGAGAFSSTPGLAHLTSPVTVAAGATAADAWAVGSPAWPGPGTYQVDAEWRLQCGGVTQVIAPATTSFQVVPAAPTLAAPAPGALLATRTPTFSGTALGGASVTVTVGGTTCGPVTASGGGAWSCTLGSPLADGAYSATAVQTVSGATSDASAAVAFTVDATPPAVTISTPAADALLGGAAAPAGAVAFSGTAEAGATVVVSAGAASATATRSGTAWTATLTLADGPVGATATATDAAGNAGTATVSFSLDVTPPAAPSIGSPASGATLSAADAPGGFVTVSGSAEAGAGVQVTVDGLAHAATRSGTAWSTTFSLADGSHAASAVATDAAGNASAPSSWTFSVDTTPPAAPTFASPTDGAVLGLAQAPGGVLSLSGGTAAGTTVAVTVDGVSHAAAVSGTGWSLTLTLGEGLHPASAVAADAAGNPSAPSAIAFRVDLTPPAVPLLSAVPTPTRADPIAVGGSAEAGATVELFLDGASQGSAAASPAFAFSLAGVAAGEHSVTAVARDAAGNASLPSAARAFLVDRTPPGLASLDAPADGAWLGAAQAPAGSVTFSGTSELGSTVEVEVDGAVLGIAAAPAGTWSATWTVVDGLHGVRVRATDAAGNVGAWSASSAFRLDTAGPLAPALDALGGPTAAAVVTVTGVAELGAEVGVFLDGAFVGTAAAPSGAFSLEVAPAEGSHAVTAVARDAAGNVSAPSEPVALVVDRTPPAAPSLDPLAAATNAAAVTVAGSSDAGTVVTVYRDGVAVGTATESGGRFALEVPVGEGTFAFTASAVDAAGNVSEASAAIGVTVDRIAPAAPSLDPLGAPTNAAPLVLSGSAEAGTTVTIFRDGVAVASAAESGGRFSVPVPVGEGTFAFTAVAADAAGNASAASGAISVTVDRTAPSAPSLDPLVTPTNAATVTLAGTADDGTTVTLRRDGVAVATAVAAAGRFSATVPLFAGTATFTAVAADAAGNVSPSSGEVTLVVDHDVPAAPVLDPLASPTNAASVAVTGTADAGTTVTLLQDGVPAAAAVAAPGGGFSFAVAVPEGTTTFTAVAADAAGNVSAGSAPVSVLVDRLAPDAPLLAALDSPSAATTVTVAGTAEPGSVVTVYLDGTSAGTTAAAPEGAFALDVAVTDGVRTFVATATDAAGNVSGDSGAAVVQVDHLLPPPPVLGALASPTNATTLTVAGTAEVGATVTVLLGGTPVGTAEAADGTFALDLAVPEGILALTATARDAGGNASAQSATIFVTVDRTAPGAPVVGAPVDAAVLGAAAAPAGAVALAGTAEAGARVEVDVESATSTVPAPSGGWAVTLPLSDGAHRVRARATDAAGNAGAWSAWSAFTVDTAAPAAPSLDPLGPPTTAATVVVSGRAEPGATVTVLDGAPAGSATAAGDGTFAVVVAVAEGAHAFTATARDAAGNVSPASGVVAVTVDRTAPAAPSLDPLATPTNAATVLVAGSAEAGATVTILRGGAPVASVAAAGGTFAVAVAVPEGPSVLTATAADAAGNVSGSSGAVSVTVDRTPPAAPSFTAATTWTSASPVGVAGTAESGCTVTVLDGGVVVGSAVAIAGGFSLSLPLAEGSHLLTAVAVDAAGNASAASFQGTWFVDRTPPLAATVAAPADGALLGAGQAPAGVVALSGTSELDSVVDVELDSGAPVQAGAPSGGWSLDSAALADGVHHVRVRARDRAGNAGPWSAVSTFTLDTAAPLAPTFDPVPPTSAIAVVLAGAAEPGDEVAVLVDGALVGTATAAADGSFSLAVPLAEGTHAFAATATDAAGNSSSATASATVVVDRTAPAAPAITALPGPTNASPLVVSGTAEAGATVTVTVDGVAGGSAVAGPDGSWSVPVSVAEGTHTVGAGATDAAGNASGASTPVTVVADRTVPAAPVFTAPLAGSAHGVGGVVLEGTAEVGVTVSVVVNGTTYADVVGADGVFSVTATLPAGSWTATATAVDAASNASPPASVSFLTRNAPAGSEGGGGCGCGPGGGAPASALLFLALALVLVPRRRARAG